MTKMWVSKAVVLIIICITFCAVTAINVFNFEDKEVIYNWKAIVKAGTQLPLPHFSLFILTGRIHLQSNTNDSIYVSITDLAYKLYNGVLDHRRENEAHSIPFPQEAKDLEKVFKIVYNNNGLIEGIVTEETEKEFSRNIKKAIATILQANDSVVSKEYQHSESFVTQENSIYGHGFVDYLIYPPKNSVIEVHKLHDMPDASYLYKDSISNGKNNFWKKNFDHPLMHSSKKIYSIGNENGSSVVKHIQSVGTVVYYPYEAKSDAHQIVVVQTFQLEIIVSKEKEFHIETERLDQSLTYHAYQILNDDIIDITNGRHVLNYDKLLLEARNILKDIPVYLEEDHINTQEPDTKRGQQINRLHRILTKFNTLKLDELGKILSNYSLEVFYHILPLVGTSATTLYVKNLIINKLVNEKITVNLLQSLYENVAPSLNLLTEMEDLMHLNNSFSWEVRKRALLSFGSLVYKSFSYTKLHQINSKSEDELQKPYQKYVEEYANRLKTEKEYRIQMVYILGLRNMKLPLVLKHLFPGFNGELWHDQHLRFLCLWAATPTILESSDSTIIMETLWPIFTNRQELTEMRIIAYYFIMKSQPSHSRLKNIFSYMLTESDEEVYHYCYSYLEAIINSKNPENQEMRVKLIQMIKFSPPPKHGVSAARYYGYTDANYHFGFNIEDQIITTNRSRIHAFYLKSHFGSKVQEESLFFVKLHDGRPSDPGITFTLPESILMSAWKGDHLGDKYNGNGNHIEGAFVQRNQVVNCYYFDKDNLAEVEKILEDFLTNDKLKKFLGIRYQVYEKTLIPTDLGFPAIWEFMMPEVYQNKLSLKQKNKGTWQIENKYVSWIHFRYGLSFYNSISDVWQGINRYHAYDAVFPLTFESSLNIIEGKISWKKHKDPLMNVAGLRSHVKQMVFVKHDDKENILAQSSPNALQFQKVGHEQRFRHNYTLIDVDNLDTGHRWFASVFDSDSPITKGSLKHQWHLFTQTITKQMNSPVEHVALSYLNWRQYIMLLPDAGNYGCILRIEPSRNFDVQSIDFSYFHLGSFAFGGEVSTNPYVRGIAEALKFNYTVRNDHSNLKTWNFRGYFDLKPGHSIVNVNVNITRFIPDERDFKICVKGVKKWLQKSVTGDLEILVGYLENDAFISDKVAEINMIGNPSSEQLEGTHKYASCEHIRPYFKEFFSTLECETAPATLRHYQYSIKTKNISKEFRNDIINGLASYYYSYAMQRLNQNEQITDDNIKVDVVYPMEVEEVNVQINTPQRTYDLSGLPTKYLHWFGLYPDNAVFPQSIYMKHRNGWVHNCLVYNDHLKFDGKSRSDIVPNNWTLYVQDSTTYYQIYIKRISNETLAVKLKVSNHTLEIHPHEDSLQLLVDDEKVQLQEQQNKGWIYYRSLMDDIDQSSVLFWIPANGLFFQYYARIPHVNIVVSIFGSFSGHCFPVSEFTNRW